MVCACTTPCPIRSAANCDDQSAGSRFRQFTVHVQHRRHDVCFHNCAGAISTPANCAYLTAGSGLRQYPVRIRHACCVTGSWVGQQHSCELRRSLRTAGQAVRCVYAMCVRSTACIPRVWQLSWPTVQPARSARHAAVALYGCQLCKQLCSE